MKALPEGVHVWLTMQLKPDRVAGPVSRAVIEPGAVCNLRCPGCTTGRGELRLSRAFLKPEGLRRMLSALGGGVRRLLLYNWGEPLLNGELPALVAEASARGIETRVSSSLSIPAFDREAAEALVRSGLGELRVACDGATQEVYALYRVGGDLEVVLRNVRLLLEAKARLASERPRIVWHYLVHRGNQREAGRAREAAAALGISIRFQELWVPEAERPRWAAEPGAASPGAPAVEPGPLPGLCLEAWDEPVLHADGTVFPCCLVADARWGLGSVFEEPFAELWNKPLVVAMRRYLRTGERPALELPCAGCVNDPYRAAAGLAHPAKARSSDQARPRAALSRAELPSRRPRGSRGRAAKARG